MPYLLLPCSWRALQHQAHMIQLDGLKKIHSTLRVGGYAVEVVIFLNQLRRNRYDRFPVLRQSQLHA